MDPRLAAELWHLAVAVMGVVTFFIGWDRYFNAPERKRRAEVEKRLSRVEWELEQGEKRMDSLKEKDEKVLIAVQTLTDAVTGLKMAVSKMEGALQGSVFKGVGEPK